MRRWLQGLWVVVVLVTASCARLPSSPIDAPSDSSSRDSGSRDSGLRDSGSRDSGSRDSGLRDSHPHDFGPHDAAVSPGDRSVSDLPKASDLKAPPDVAPVADQKVPVDSVPAAEGPLPVPDAGVTSYATWNPQDKATNIVLSTDRLTASVTTSSVNDSVRATISKSSGKWYWEVTISKRGSSNYNGVGFATAQLPLELSPRDDTNGGCEYSAAGGIFCGGTTAVGVGQSYLAGDVLGIALNLNDRTAYFRRNGSWQTSPPGGGGGMALGGTAAPIFPVVNLSSGDETTAHFGASTLKYSPPAGYKIGWYK